MLTHDEQQTLRRIASALDDLPKALVKVAEIYSLTQLAILGAGQPSFEAMNKLRTILAE